MQTKTNILTKEHTSLVYEIVGHLCECTYKPVIMCLGTDKVIADSLGPIVGNLLTTKYNINTYVYGKLKRTVNAININTYYDHIKSTHSKHKILVVDASLGKESKIGSINVSRGGVVPYNSALLKKIGDINITTVVLKNNFCNKQLMTSTKLSFIYQKAEIIARAIYNAYAIVY